MKLIALAGGKYLAMQSTCTADGSGPSQYNHELKGWSGTTTLLYFYRSRRSQSFRPAYGRLNELWALVAPGFPMLAVIRGPAVPCNDLSKKETDQLLEFETTQYKI